MNNYENIFEIFMVRVMSIKQTELDNKSRMSAVTNCFQHCT